jgi:hypothetical protein
MALNCSVRNWNSSSVRAVRRVARLPAATRAAGDEIADRAADGAEEDREQAGDHRDRGEQHAGVDGEDAALQARDLLRADLDLGGGADRPVGRQRHGDPPPVRALRLGSGRVTDTCRSSCRTSSPASATPACSPSARC